MKQIPFDISLPPSYHAADFIVSDCNENAYRMIESWQISIDKIMLLRGPEASGKTHLSHIWAQAVSAGVYSAEILAEGFEPDALFSQFSNIVLRDCHEVENPASLFHLLNHVKSSASNRLLLTIDESSCWSSFTLPDLRSRLQALPQTSIATPDDKLLETLLAKGFNDKQITLSQAQYNYLKPRIPRSFRELKQFIDRLDYQMMSLKRPINRQLIEENLTNY